MINRGLFHSDFEQCLSTVRWIVGCLCYRPAIIGWVEESGATFHWDTKRDSAPNMVQIIYFFSFLLLLSSRRAFFGETAAQAQDMATTTCSQKIGIVGYGHLGVSHQTIYYLQQSLVKENMCANWHRQNTVAARSVLCPCTCIRPVPGGEDTWRWGGCRFNSGICLEQKHRQAQRFSSRGVHTSRSLSLCKQVTCTSSPATFKRILKCGVIFTPCATNAFCLCAWQAVWRHCGGVPSTYSQRVWDPFPFAGTPYGQELVLFHQFCFERRQNELVANNDFCNVCRLLKCLNITANYLEQRDVTGQFHGCTLLEYL